MGHGFLERQRVQIVGGAICLVAELDAASIRFSSLPAWLSPKKPSLGDCDGVNSFPSFQSRETWKAQAPQQCDIHRKVLVAEQRFHRRSRL